MYCFFISLYVETSEDALIPHEFNSVFPLPVFVCIGDHVTLIIDSILPTQYATHGFFCAVYFTFFIASHTR